MRGTMAFRHVWEISWWYLQAPNKSAGDRFFWPEPWRPSAEDLFSNVNNTIIAMTYIFKAIFMVRFKMFNPKKAQLMSNPNRKCPLHVNNYRIENPVKEQMEVSLLVLPHRWVEISFKGAEKEKKCMYVESNIQNLLKLRKYMKKVAGKTSWRDIWFLKVPASVKCVCS